MSCNVAESILNLPVDPTFQSLSGFPMSCNETYEFERPTKFRFQSLSGFPMSCNLRTVRELTKRCMFQSLSGFPMSCNYNQAPVRRMCNVSIPIGFSNELQPIVWYQPLLAPPFQSLSGFPMSCNRAPLGLQMSRCLCFNPYRVFQ